MQNETAQVAQEQEQTVANDQTQASANAEGPLGRPGGPQPTEAEQAGQPVDYPQTEGLPSTEDDDEEDDEDDDFEDGDDL
jgi:hypothetical protein